jgi:hypothetical protein
MHLFSILIAPAITAAFVHATNLHCLSNDQAATVVEQYTDLITHTQADFNLTLATQLLASDYHSMSDGVDYVREKPVRADYSPPYFPASCPSKLHFAPAPSSSLLLMSIS